MGLKPNEIKQLHLWEFNQYVLAYQEKIKEKEKNIIKVAYYMAYFNNNKKTKSLNYYLKEIDNTTKTNKKRDNTKLDFARKMYANELNFSQKQKFCQKLPNFVFTRISNAMRRSKVAFCGENLL